MSAPTSRAVRTSAHYDQAYFDKWYRNPRHRVKSATELQRQLLCVVHMAEWVLGRQITSVLDVGCGEGQWRPLLKRLRPRLKYDGVDPSPYAVQRFGARRNLQLGGIEDLDALPLASGYDLVVCCGMLNYLARDNFSRGVEQVARRTNGMAYLEVFSRSDVFEGDTSWPTPQPASWYRRTIAKAGLLSVGLHGYIPERDAARVAALECAR